VNVKMLLHPAPQKFNTFNIFNTFAIFSPALEYPALVHRQALRVRSVWDRATDAWSGVRSQRICSLWVPQKFKLFKPFKLFKLFATGMSQPPAHSFTPASS
jgi:hypothetical protein